MLVAHAGERLGSNALPSALYGRRGLQGGGQAEIHPLDRSRLGGAPNDCLVIIKVVGFRDIVPGGAPLTRCTIEHSLAFGQVGDVLP
jgi:hypothetical protein